MHSKVSIIVPCFNQADYLPEALDSVLQQTYDNWECIIVNDGSTDATEKAALKYCSLDARFKYVYQDNKGVSAARNNGVSLAEGEYILPLDGDDFISPIYVEQAMQAFKKDPDLKLVYGEAEFIGERIGKFKLDEYSYLRLLISNVLFCSAVYKREDFDRINGYSEKLIYGFEDWDFWIRLLDENSKVLKLPEVVLFYRIKDVSRSTDLLLMDRKSETERMIYKMNSEIYNKHMFEIIHQFKKHYYRHNELVDLKRSRTYKTLQKLNSFKKLLGIR